MSSDSGSSPVSSGMNSTALGGRMSTIFNGGVSAVVGRVSSSVATTSFDGRSSGGMKWAPSSSMATTSFDGTSSGGMKWAPSSSVATTSFDGRFSGGMKWAPSSSVATTSFDGRSSGGMKWAPSSSALLEGSELGVTIISTGSGSNIGAVSYSRYRFYQWSRFYSITLSDNVRAVYSIAMCFQILNNLFTR